MAELLPGRRAQQNVKKSDHGKSSVPCDGHKALDIHPASLCLSWKTGLRSLVLDLSEDLSFLPKQTGFRCFSFCGNTVISIERI